MVHIRRQFLRLVSGALAFPATTGIVLAQAPQAAGPKLTPILRGELLGQDQKVQETVVNVLDMGPT